jgi:hypothetical protein
LGHFLPLLDLDAVGWNNYTLFESTGQYKDFQDREIVFLFGQIARGKLQLPDGLPILLEISGFFEGFRVT